MNLQKKTLLPVLLLIIIFSGGIATANGKDSNKVIKTTIDYPNGDHYKGETINGKRIGKGKLTCADGKVYEGIWVDDDLRHGKLTYKKTGHYEGFFRNLQLDGYGTRYYPDKKVTGLWKENNRHGIVTETDKHGHSSTSLYKNGVKLDGINVGKSDYVMGIDLSNYQQNVVWQDLYLAGDSAPDYRLPRNLKGKVTPIEFVIMKATEGGNHVDKSYLTHRDNAERHNYRKGYYHFYNTTASATANAYNYINNVTLDKGDFPPILDIEKDGVPADSLLKWIKIIEKHYKRKPMIYTNERYYKKYVEGTKLEKYPLWYSRFGQRVIDRNAHILQFTEKGLVDGVRNHVVDINEFRRGDLHKFLK